MVIVIIVFLKVIIVIIVIMLILRRVIKEAEAKIIIGIIIFRITVFRIGVSCRRFVDQFKKNILLPRFLPFVSPLLCGYSNQFV